MGANAIGNESMGGYVSISGGVGGGTANDLQSTIDRLSKQREKLEQQNRESNSRAADRRIGDIDDRIKNLEKRLEKLKEDDGECQTCESRRYQDVSDDSGVSFQNATKVGKGAEEAAVRGHEYEHVSRNQAKADREGQEIVYQTVTIKHAICPECGRTYVAGGETKTVTRNKPAKPEAVEQSDKKTAKPFDKAADKPNKTGRRYGVQRSDKNEQHKIDRRLDAEKNGQQEQVSRRFDVGRYDYQQMAGQLLNVLA